MELLCLCVGRRFALRQYAPPHVYAAFRSLQVLDDRSGKAAPFLSALSQSIPYKINPVYSPNISRPRPSSQMLVLGYSEKNFNLVVSSRLQMPGLLSVSDPARVHPTSQNTCVTARLHLTPNDGFLISSAFQFQSPLYPETERHEIIAPSCALEVVLQVVPHTPHAIRRSCVRVLAHMG